MLDVDDFPNCCKAYTISSFYSDNYYTWEWVDKIYTRIVFSLEEIYKKNKDRLTNIIRDQWGYDELCLIAAVTVKQTQAEKVLKEFGFQLFNTTYNEGSYDEEVRFYSLLLKEGEHWHREEEEEYWEGE